MRWTALLTILLSLVSCHQWKVPSHAFGESIPAAPTYANRQHWACLPDRVDACDTVPVSSLSDRQEYAPVDVFFLYPSIFDEKKAWNAAIDDSKLNETLDETTLRHQASIFNGAAKVYVPYYRQMTYYGFWGKEEDQHQALQLSLSDATAAFTYYMEHFNQGRPYIIAGHSQGGWLVYQLIEGVLPTRPEWQEQMIAAYAVGWTILDEELTQLPVCSTATQTGCLVSWNTYGWGHLPDGHYSAMPLDPICVNPLNWRADTTYAPFAANLGGVGRKYRKVYLKATDAQIHQGYLWIHKDNLPGMAKWLNRFHAADYNLFWMNVRQNASDRSLHWIETNN